MACEECSLFHREKLVNRKGGFYHFLESPLQVPPTPRFFNWGVYYRWEKLGPGNPALCPLKRAQITLDFSYNSFILSSQILEVASDQEAPDAGLAWRIRGKENAYHCTSGGIWGGFLERSSQGQRGALAAGKGWVMLYVRTVSGGSREDAGLDPSLEFKALPTTSSIPQERVWWEWKAGEGPWSQHSSGRWGWDGNSRGGHEGR